MSGGYLSGGYLSGGICPRIQVVRCFLSSCAAGIRTCAMRL